MEFERRRVEGDFYISVQDSGRIVHVELTRDLIYYQFRSSYDESSFKIFYNNERVDIDSGGRINHRVAMAIIDMTSKMIAKFLETGDDYDILYKINHHISLLTLVHKRIRAALVKGKKTVLIVQQIMIEQDLEDAFEALYPITKQVMDARKRVLSRPYSP